MRAHHPANEAACDVRGIHLDAVRRSRQALEEVQELPATAALLAALADPTRLRMLLALRAGALCTCDLAAVLGVTESAVSHQLRTLKVLALVESERAGKVVFHRIAGAHANDLLDVAIRHAGGGPSAGAGGRRAA